MYQTLKPSFKRIVDRAPSSHEDRLTEIFALVLQLSPILAMSFLTSCLAKANLNRGEVGLSRIRIQDLTPQFSIPGTHLRVDLAIDTQEVLLWVEAKLDSGLREGQLRDYYGHLQRLKGDKLGLLVFLAREGRSKGPVALVRSDLEEELQGPIDLVPFDWREVCEVADGVKSATQSEEGVVKELSRYLKESRAILPPITKEIIPTIRAISETTEALWDLLQRTIGRVYEDLGKEQHKHPHNWERWPRFPRYEATYRIAGLADQDDQVLLEWNFDQRSGDDWGEGEPLSFAWGLTLVDPTGQWPSESLVERMENHGFAQLVDDGHPRLFKERVFESFLDAADVSMDGAVEELAQIIIKDLRLAERLATEELETTEPT